MPTSLEVLFTPAEFAACENRDLSRTTCVVFDVLRATSTMLTALANGASAIIPAGSITEALDSRVRRPDVLLGGERNGLRIQASLTGGVEFDLGNSPREYTPERVRGKTIVITTTNGTRALRACRNAERVLIGGFLNLGATAEAIARLRPHHLLLVCSGTGEGTAWEDALAAGAICDRLRPLLEDPDLDDSAHIAGALFAAAKADLAGSLSQSRNARRLLALAELREDVPRCLEIDRLGFTAGMGPDGAIRRLP